MHVLKIRESHFEILNYVQDNFITLGSKNERTIVKITLLGGADHVAIVSVDFTEGADFGGGTVLKAVAREVDVSVTQVGAHVGRLYIPNDGVIVELHYLSWKFLETFYNVNNCSFYFILNKFITTPIHKLFLLLQFALHTFPNRLVEMCVTSTSFFIFAN